jgi:DNA-binding response OmpR family regulator
MGQPAAVCGAVSRSAPPDLQDLAGPRVARPMRGSAVMITRVAIADDDPDTRELLRRTLQSEHVTIVEAESGAELVEILVERDRADLVVTDVAMPWSSGLDVMASARRSGISTPVLVISASCEPSLAIRVHALGRARLLRKPFGPAELREAIEALLASCAPE